MLRIYTVHRDPEVLGKVAAHWGKTESARAYVVHPERLSSSKQPKETKHALTH